MERCTDSIGLLLHLADLGFDVFVCYTHWKNNDLGWFWMTAAFIVIPSLIVNITSIFQQEDSWPWRWRCLAAALQFSVVRRYIEAFRSNSHPYYPLAKLRYLETIMESAPQLCLQNYIMLRQGYFPSLTVLSSVLSLLSFTWSIRTLEKARANDEKSTLNCTSTFFFMIWQLSTLISRLSAIVVFAYLFRGYIFVPVAVHLVLLLLIVLCTQNTCKERCLSLLSLLPSLFHISQSVIPSETSKLEMRYAYWILILENFIMVILSLAIEMRSVPHMDVVEEALIVCLLGGTFLSIAFFFLYISFRKNQNFI